MGTKKITYNDKVAIVPPGVRENQVWDVDMNEIKRVVNDNADELIAMLGLLNLKEDSGNKQNTLSADPTNTKYPSVTAVLEALKANIESPALTGTPTAPTATAGTNTTQVANTLFVNNAIGINSTETAYVRTNGNNSTAEIGNLRKPFLTIDAALDALPATGGVINIGIGSFMSPTKTKIKSYVKFFGSGKPVTNSTYSYAPLAEKPTISSPTKLVGGTILLGTIEVSLKDGIEFHNLGVDSGLDYCNTYKAGVAQEGLIIVQEYNLAGGLPSADGFHQLQTNSPPRTGIVVNNVSALCKTAASPVHAMLIENTINAKISNVSTYFGTYGLVIKSIGCNVNGLDAHGHAEAGLIFKANDYAYGRHNSATNIYVTSIVGYDGGGITFVSEHSILAFVTLTNFNVEFTTYGISNTSSGGIHTEGHTISNGIIYKTQGIGIDIDSTFLNSVFSNIDQRQATTGYLIRQNYSAIRTFLYFTQCKSSENTTFNWDIVSSSLSEVSLNYCNGQSGSSTVSGNIFGNLQESSSLIGSMNKSAVAGDFISAIDSKGILKKTPVTFDGFGGIHVTGLLIKKAGSNSIGQGSSIILDNGASGTLQRQMVCQLNASNNLDLWYYNGSVFSLTSIVLKNTGVIKSKVYTVSSLPVGEKGDTSFVSDALSPIFGNTVVGGGAVGVPVYHDGISWKVG